jgi:hypothetical protein
MANRVRFLETLFSNVTIRSSEDGEELAAMFEILAGIGDPG